MNAFFAVVYDDIVVSKYTSSLAYLHANGKLFCAFYGVYVDNLFTDFPYLMRALSSVYGDAVEVDPETIIRFMEQVETVTYDCSDCYEWRAADRTTIWLLICEEEVCIIYVAPDFDMSQVGEYNVTGL